MAWTKIEPFAGIGMWCATQNCWGIPFHRFEVDGVASNYCGECRAKIELLNPPLENTGETGNARAVPAMTGSFPVAGTPTNSTTSN